MALLSRDAILNAKDRATKDVDVPEWGGSVRVRTMSGTERDNWEGTIAAMTDKSGKLTKFDNLRAKLVALTVVDGEGNRLFKDDDIKALGKKSAAALDRVFAAAQSLNGMSNADIEELTKN